MKYTFTTIALCYALGIFGQNQAFPEIKIYLPENKVQTLSPQTDSAIHSTLNQSLLPKQIERPPMLAHFQIDSAELERRRLQKTLGSYEEFKRKLLALDIKDNSPDLGNLNPYAGEFILTNPVEGGGFGTSMGGPISAIYSKFSRTEISKRKYNTLKKFETSRQTINAKYNHKRLQQWTGLKDDELTQFVIYCKFDDEFLLAVSEYTLIDSVLKKLTAFKKLEN